MDNFGQRNPSGDVQAPVNIFTPNFSSQAMSPADPSPQPGLRHSAFFNILPHLLELYYEIQGAFKNAETGYNPPTSSGPGWNDPPPLSSISRPKAQVKTVNTMPTTFEPITQPLFGAPVAQPIPDPGSMGMQQHGYNQFQPQGFQNAAPPQHQYNQG